MADRFDSWLEAGLRAALTPDEPPAALPAPRYRMQGFRVPVHTRLAIRLGTRAAIVGFTMAGLIASGSAVAAVRVLDPTFPVIGSGVNRSDACTSAGSCSSVSGQTTDGQSGSGHRTHTPTANGGTANGQGNSGSAPGQGGSHPGSSGSAPGQGGNSPGNSGSAPGQGGGSPGNSGSAPGHGGSSPGNSGSAPGQSGTSPGNSGSAPGQSGTSPGNSGNAPGASTGPKG